VHVRTGTCVPSKDVTEVDDETEIGYPVYWVGGEINGLEFSSLESTDGSTPRGRSVTFDYGAEPCDVGFGDEGCSIPLTITTMPYCEVPFRYGGEGWRKSEFRGAKRYDYSSQIILETGSVVVQIQATNRANSGLAAEALFRLSTSGGTRLEDLLPPPEQVDCFPPSAAD